MKIGELAERAGVSARALRYYEEQGLLRAERTPAGQRVYQEDDVDRVRLYQQFYAAGLTSSHIAQLLPCIESGHTDAEQRAMLREQRARIHERVDELMLALARLDELIDATHHHV
ncbi:MerR family transcriptional regulator [Amycolatopsis taiwanensis]|uniref:MerR family transcriptional regulator n=1 Tax=Amycolatopsis taiwanensis TaxID=342230 RepID=A0A9W6R067_9PSEU|nr:MerR family transcriptional regulator [Amycolatopsis taiwanensis]GLY66045.1 MerR family transcriptional regulator [Amycolatopsis taiwanensis]